MTDIESIRLQIVTRLPTRVRWMVKGVPLDFDFSLSKAPLEPVKPSNFNSATIIEKEWTSLRIFGGYDYAEGGGANPFLGVHSESGAVFGLDAELQASQMFLFNSDVDRFIQTFLALDRTLRLGGRPDAQIAEKLKEIDPGVFGQSEWRSLVDYVTQ
jgi:hypothetical protein